MECFVANLRLNSCQSKTSYWVVLIASISLGRYTAVQALLALPILPFFYYSINNAYILKKHNCSKHGVRPKDILQFLLELLHELLEDVGQKHDTVHSKGVARAHGVKVRRFQPWA